MEASVSFKRLILRAVLRHVSPMVIRLISVPDHMDLPEFHRTILAESMQSCGVVRLLGRLELLPELAESLGANAGRHLPMCH